MADPAIPSRDPGLKGTQRTLFLTLYAKAADARSPHSVLHDRKAEEIVRTAGFELPDIRARLGPMLVARARELDDATRDWFRYRPDSVVVNLGCGLDSRVERVATPAGIDWFDVDFPEVIELRRRFFTERPGYRMLSTDIGDLVWIAGLPLGRPALVLADGVLEYVDPTAVRALFRALIAHFPSGRMVFDVMNSRALGMVSSALRASNAQLRWAVDDLREVDAFDPKLRRLGARSVFSSRYLPLRYRTAFAFAAVVPSLRTLTRILRYDF